MKPQRILFVRHGQSESNVDAAARETIRDHEIALTEKGREQAVAAGKEISEILLHLPTVSWIEHGISIEQPRRVRIYSSSFRRARETLEGIEKGIGAITWKGQDIIEGRREDPRLREQEWGHLRLRSESDYIDRERNKHGTFYYRIPDGESGADVYDRCTGVLDTLYRDFEERMYPHAALIVGHGFAIRILLMRWLHWSVERFEETRNLRNCEILQLQLGQDGHYHPVEPFL